MKMLICNSQRKDRLEILSEQSRDHLSEKKRMLLMHLLREQAHAQTTEQDSSLPTIVPDPAHRYEPFPLTEIQQAYWIGRSAIYELGDISIHAYVEVEGSAIDLKRLEETWQQIVVRHDMLRAIVLPDGQQQILEKVPPYALQIVDLRKHSMEIADIKLTAIREELSQQVLNAEIWPGFDIRASLLEGGRTRIHISIDLLHIDGGSLMILIDEWTRLYQDTAASLPPLELSFRDYVLGGIALQESEFFQRSLTYWRERVTTLPPAPELPMAQRPGTLTHTYFRRRSATLEAKTWQRLKERSIQSGLTPSVVLLTAYAKILAFWGKDVAFTMNVTLFNRLPLHPQVNSILGDFSSMILLEVANAPGESFATSGKKIQKELWAGLEHRYVSGIQVQRELVQVQKKTTGSLMPVVFTSLLDLTAQGFRPPLSSLHTLGEVVYSVTQTPQVWLDHQVLEEDGMLVLTWDAVEDIFPAGLLDDMFTAYCQFLQQLVDDEDAWQDHYSIPLPREQQVQRSRINATDAPIPAETLYTLFLKQAAQHPDQPALVSSDRTLTYAQTLRHASQLGHTLQALGAQPNSLVAVVMEKGWEQTVATLGIHAAGAAYLPVDPALPLERRNYLLKQSNAQFAVTQSWLDQQLVWPEDIRRICIDNDALADVDDTPLEPAQGPEDLSHVIYTSGSTGLPKGVMLEHRSVVNCIVDTNQRLGVGPGDRMLALTALHHDMSVYDIFGILAAGGTMVIPDAGRARDPAHWAELMVRERVTLWNSVPAFLQMLMEYLEQRADQPELLPRFLRYTILGGDWIPVTLPDRLRALLQGVQVIACGGPTETTIWNIWYPVREVDPTWQSIPYGKPMHNTRYHVLNHSLEPCPVWVPGQLYIGGTGLARGYWQDEEKTCAHFLTHPHTGERLYRSGDIGRYLPDGNIEFLGREDLQVKIRGYRIELGEIEAALQQHPAIHAAVVTAVAEPTGSRRLVAYVVPKPESTPYSSNASVLSSHGKNLDDFKQEQIADIAILDPVARIDFKLNQWGIRRDTDHQTIQIPSPEPDEALLRTYTERRSVRDFANGLLPFAQFGQFLRSLALIEMDGLPKYRYASGGGLYPVQTYLYIKPDRIEGIPGGVYYYHPKQNQLLLMSSEAHLDNSTQVPHNREIFDKAAFVIFLLGQLKAIEPLYGGLARDFCLLEAGHMSQFLMMVAPAHQIGLCPIGAMEFESIRHFFHLEESHVLLQLLFGGEMGSEPHLPEISVTDATSMPEATGPGTDSLIDELRTFLKQKLPEQMQPSAYVMLEKFPLTSNGKVDRQALPSLEEASESVQPLDTLPRNDVERALIKIAQEVLHREQVGIHQNFFDLGGNSLHMVQILNKVRATFQRELPITEIFRHPTISSLAAYLSQEQSNEPTLAQSDERASDRKASLARRNERRQERVLFSQEEGSGR